MRRSKVLPGCSREWHSNLGKVRWICFSICKMGIRITFLTGWEG